MKFYGICWLLILSNLAWMGRGQYGGWGRFLNSGGAAGGIRGYGGRLGSSRGPGLIGARGPYGRLG